jgi:hypothetical protein
MLNCSFYAKIDDKTGYIVLAHFNQKASNETSKQQRTKPVSERIVLGSKYTNPGGLLNSRKYLQLFVKRRNENAQRHRQLLLCHCMHEHKHPNEMK